MIGNELLMDSFFSKIPSLTDSQIYWLNNVIDSFSNGSEFTITSSDIINEKALSYFGDALRIHHTFSAESFSKDKFEYVLETSLKMSGVEASLAPKGNRGHDITINGIPVSLKTQADKTISKSKIWISKYMELGKGPWADDFNVLARQRQHFFDHMKNYERIFTLRTLSRAPNWKYELVEIPKNLLLMSESGSFEMKFDSTQDNKPGYCYVRNNAGELLYQLYFDGGGERKLQIQHLLISNCIIHANWNFTTSK